MYKILSQKKGAFAVNAACSVSYTTEKEAPGEQFVLRSLEAGLMPTCEIGIPESTYFLGIEKQLQWAVLTTKPESIGCFIHLL